MAEIRMVFPAPKSPDCPVAGQTIYQGFISVFGRKHVVHQDSRIGVKRAAPHHLRHTSATEMSVDIGQQQMMELFGWSDPSMLGIYRHQAEQLGLLVRDAQNQLHSAAGLKKAAEAVAVFESMSTREQERHIAELVARMHRRLAAMKAPAKKTAKKAAKKTTKASGRGGAKRTPAR